MAVIEGLLPRPAARRYEAPRAGRRVVRPAYPNEAAVLSCLHRSLARTTFAFEDCIEPGPAAPGAIVLVCEVSEAIAGYLCVGDPRLASGAAAADAAAGWQLHAIGVAPQFRRTGVATDLWRASLALLPATVTTVAGDVRDDTIAAAAWFQAHGFGLQGQTHFSADVAALRAHLDLPRPARFRAGAHR